MDDKVSAFLSELAEVAKKYDMGLMWSEFDAGFWVEQGSEQFTNELLESVDARERYAEMEREREERERNRKQFIRDQQKGFEHLLPEEPRLGE